jgi:probable O-glycosylation ligase (exosortase A-associated)
MRDILIIAVLAVCAAVTLFHPWVGIMGWTAISIMNPHRYSWAASDWPVAAAIVVATLVGMLLTRDRIRFFVSPVLVVLVMFAAWMCITLPASIHPSGSYPMWKQVMKIDFMIIVAAIVLTTRRHIMALAWVLVCSIGIYGVKGGIFTIATGGNYRVWGPPDSFIEGNNELALALVMTIPLMRFLQLHVKARLARYGLALAMLLSAVAALGTHSRGALLALIAMAIVLWTRTRHKIVSGIALVLVGAALIAFMPGEWENRMNTIANYEEDASAMGRINAWRMAWNLAVDRPFGGGYDIYWPEVFQRDAPVPDDVHAAHSIYFQVLGEHGFVGLGLFLLLWIMAWRTAGVLRRTGPLLPQTQWTTDLGAMTQASLAGYAVGGAFLSLAYFDLPYNLMLLVVLARQWVAEKGWERESVAAPPAVAARPVSSTVST